MTDDENEQLRARSAGMEAAWRNACERGDAAVAKLAEARRLLEAWMGHSEHRHLTYQEFNKLVWDSQDFVDSTFAADKGTESRSVQRRKAHQRGEPQPDFSTTESESDEKG